MKAKWFSTLLVVVLLVVAVVPSVGAAPAGQGSATPAKIVVSKFGTTTIGSGGGSPGDDTLGPIATEIQRPKRRGSNPLRSDPGAGDAVSLAPGTGSSASSGKKAKSNPEINLSFEGLNHLDSRLAFNGNQFSGEPADQGVCVGNGYILETVNSALQVYNANNGSPASPVLALNEFYGFPPAIDRTNAPNFVFGPFTFDIYCHYDPDSNRWFHLAVDLDQDPVTGAFNGKNYIDLAVSTSGDPRGSWNVYRIPGINDGTEGTPDHNCAGGPCFADFPHLGVDKNGVYVTTNEFPLFEDGFTGAQVYAISKQALVSGANSIDVYLFDTSQAAWRVREGEPGFTLWPALSAAKQFEGAQGGTNYFVSSNAVFDDANGDSEEIIVWGLSNTKSLNSANPSLSLTRTILPSQRYAVPPSSVQKSGPFPLGECLNDTSGAVGGVNCGVFFGVSPQNVSIGPIDTSDSRVLDARYANGKLWAVLGTAAEVAGQQRAGVGWFIFNASVSGSGVSASIRKQGVLAVEGESLAYPTVGVTQSGRGIIGFTRVGESLFPSYGYASIDDKIGVGPVHMIREGQSTQDGFTEYPPIGGNRPRWGDYGAAAVDGKNVYLAGQYIEQPPCTLTDFVETGFTCFGFRSSLANWSTRVTKLTP